MFVHPRQYDSAVYRDFKGGGGEMEEKREGGGGLRKGKKKKKKKKPKRLGKKRCKKIPDSPH